MNNIIDISTRLNKRKAKALKVITTQELLTYFNDYIDKNYPPVSVGQLFISASEALYLLNASEYERQLKAYALRMVKVWVVKDLTEPGYSQCSICYSYHYDEKGALDCCT